MVQIPLYFYSKEDADAFKRRLRGVKGVKVTTFVASPITPKVRKRIAKGLKDADEGRVKPWKEVKSKLLKRIPPKKK